MQKKVCFSHALSAWIQSRYLRNHHIACNVYLSLEAQYGAACDLHKLYFLRHRSGCAGGLSEPRPRAWTVLFRMRLGPSQWSGVKDGMHLECCQHDPALAHSPFTQLRVDTRPCSMLAIACLSFSFLSGLPHEVGALDHCAPWTAMLVFRAVEELCSFHTDVESATRGCSLLLQTLNGKFS